MPTRIRLARPPGHTKLTTHYHIVAVDGRKRRDAKPIEVLGIYDPVPKKRIDPSRKWTAQWDGIHQLNVLQLPKEKYEAVKKARDAWPTPEKRIEWSVKRIKYWLGVGAQPSKTIQELLERAEIVPKRPQVAERQRAPTMLDQLNEARAAEGTDPAFIPQPSRPSKSNTTASALAASLPPSSEAPSLSATTP